MVYGLCSGKLLSLQGYVVMLMCMSMSVSSVCVCHSCDHKIFLIDKKKIKSLVLSVGSKASIPGLVATLSLE